MRILIADDQSAVRFAIRVLLARQPGLHVIGEAVDAEELVSLVAGLNPDLVLLDWELPGLEADGAVKTLRQAQPQLVIIALSGRSEAGRASLEAGANAFVSKVEPPERLLAAVLGQAGLTTQPSLVA